MSDAPLIQVRNLSKTFVRGEAEIHVLEDLSLDITGGEFVALMGASGSGKTTLLNLLGALDTSDGGQIIINGLDITDLDEDGLSDWRAHTVGFIFQLYNLLPVLKAVENVELPLALFGLSKRERRKRALAALNLVGLHDRSDHYPGELSGGQEQRVAIARALVTDPTFLLADEPTGDLDPKSAGEILDLLKRLHEELGKTILMVTHSREAAARADRIIHLEAGRVALGVA
ncbi:MAG: ABC transporter ATP-binding protein [Planctomycetota bacterium]|jgi:putative ABC transport system ATP-binding protein